MFNKLSKSLCGKFTATALLATSITLATFSTMSASAALAQSSASTDGANSAASTSADSSASSQAAAPATAGDSTSASTSSSSSSSDIPPGVLWTDPKYAVKEVPPAKTQPSTKPQPTTGTTTNSSTEPKATSDANSSVYDEKAAQAFADSVSMPQYVWTKQAKPSKNAKTTAADTSKEMAAYSRSLVEKFVANMTVPNSATLVENSSNQYVYLMSFAVDARGNISKVQSVNSFGQFNALHLADDGENAAMTSSVQAALAKCSPVGVPPVGKSPWYMLLKYEPNSGKVFVANLNTI